MSDWDKPLLTGVAGSVLAFAIFMGGIVLLIHNNVAAGTERLNACVSHGGAYVHVPETGTYECSR